MALLLTHTCTAVCTILLYNVFFQSSLLVLVFMLYSMRLSVKASDLVLLALVGFVSISANNSDISKKTTSRHAHPPPGCPRFAFTWCPFLLPCKLLFSPSPFLATSRLPNTVSSPDSPCIDIPQPEVIFVLFPCTF